MSDPNPDRKECVLRALAATEIAESSSDPSLRASFFSLAEHWLEMAEARDPEAAEPRVQ